MALNWHVTSPNLIGGALVRRPLEMGGKRYRVGDTLARDQVLAIPKANRDAMISSGMIEVWPLGGQGERYLVPAAKGLYHVVEGKRVTTDPLPKNEAEALIAPKRHAAA